MQYIKRYKTVGEFMDALSVVGTTCTEIITPGYSIDTSGDFNVFDRGIGWFIKDKPLAVGFLCNTSKSRVSLIIDELESIGGAYKKRLTSVNYLTLTINIIKNKFFGICEPNKFICNSVAIWQGTSLITNKPEIAIEVPNNVDAVNAITLDVYRGPNGYDIRDAETTLLSNVRNEEPYIALTPALTSNKVISDELTPLYYDYNYNEFKPGDIVDLSPLNRGYGGLRVIFVMWRFVKV